MTKPVSCVSEFRAEPGEAVILWHKSHLFFRLLLEQDSLLASSFLKMFVHRGLKCLMVLSEKTFKLSHMDGKWNNYIISTIALE